MATPITCPNCRSEFKLPEKAKTLTPAERRLVELFFSTGGARNRVLGELLGVKEQVIKNYFLHIYRKLGITGRAKLAIACTDPERFRQILAGTHVNLHS